MTLRSISLWFMLGVSGVTGATPPNVLGNPVRVYVETPEQMQQSYKRAGGKLPHVLGWAFFLGLPPNVWGCQVHVPPLTPETVWIWRHEFQHCTDGAWHD